MRLPPHVSAGLWAESGYLAEVEPMKGDVPSVVPCPICGAQIIRKAPAKRNHTWPTARQVMRHGLRQHIQNVHPELSTRELTLTLDEAEKKFPNVG